MSFFGGMRRKGKGGTPILALLVIGILVGAYGLHYYFTTYPTSYEVATKLDGAIYNGYYLYEGNADIGGSDPDPQGPSLSASNLYYDPDQHYYNYPDAWAQMGQPMHVKYQDGQYVACDDSVYTERLERYFWSEDQQQVVKHVMDLHHYMFTVNMRTYGDFYVNHDKNKYRAEATWDDHAKNYFDMKAMSGEIYFEVFFNLRVKAWSYSVNPAVGDLENYTVEDAGVWSGILGVRVVDHPLFDVDGRGEATRKGTQGEIGLINAENDPVDLGRKDWLKAGRAWVSRTVGKNVYISANYAYDTSYIKKDGLNLPQEYTGMKLGMTGETGLSVEWDDRWGDDAIYDMWIQDIGVSYACVVDVVVDQGWTLTAPEDTLTETPEEEEEEEKEEDRPGGFWGDITGAGGAVKDWFDNRWQEAKDVGGFFGDIISGIIDLFMMIAWVIVIIIIVFILFGFVIPVLRKAKKKGGFF